MLDLKARVTSWNTNLFGAAVAVGWAALAQTLPPGCKEALGNYVTYGPAVIAAIWGLLLKGPGKQDGVIATVGEIKPKVQRVK